MHLYTVLFCTVLLSGVDMQAPKEKFKCYICNSLKDEDCQPLNKDKYYKECPLKTQNTCVKLYQKVSGSIIVDRRCSTLTTEDAKFGSWMNKCTDRVGTTAIKARYCYCDDAGCNFGTRTSASLLLLVSTFLAVLFTL